MSKRWLFFMPILLGIAIFILLKKNKSEPIHLDKLETPSYVRSMIVPIATVTPKVSGYGTVRPAVTWEAVAQVKGIIIEKHARLKKGVILKKGTQLFRIDPTDYELTIAQTEADIAATHAQLDELVIKLKDTQLALSIEQQALGLTKNELKRKRKLAGKGSVSHSDVDIQQRALLNQQQSVLNKKNSINLMPSQQSLLEARLLQYQAKLSRAKRNLSYTQVIMPFDGRISSVNIEKSQYVREGEKLIQADSLSRSEVEIQLPINRFSALFNHQELLHLANQNLNNQHQLSAISASIHFQQGHIKATWPATFTHLSDTLDPKTRTLGAIVEVHHANPPISQNTLPLFKGLFVKVILRGQKLTEQIIIPRTALHNNKVYVINKKNRLDIRDVTVSMLDDEFVIIDQGLVVGEQIVISNLIPAIEDMLIHPDISTQASQRLFALDNISHD